MVAIIALIASALVAGYSAYSSSQTANAQAKYQAKVSENNALAAQYEGQYAKEAAAKKATQHRQQVARLIGKQRAAASSSGLVVDEGSFLDVTLDTADQGELDAMVILQEGDLEAWRAKINAGNYKAQASLFSASQTNPYANGILTGAQTGLGYYSQYKASR